MTGIKGRALFDKCMTISGMAFSFILEVILVVPSLMFLLILRIRAWWIVRHATSEGLQFLSGPDAFSGHSSNCIITSAFGLAGIPDINSCRELLKQRITTVCNEDGELLYKKLLQVAVIRSGLLFWKSVEQIDINSHVVQYTGINPSTKEEMSEILADLNARKIMPEMPCWMVIFVPTKGELMTSGTACYLVLRIHHAIVDGISLMRAFSSLFHQSLKGNDEQPAAIKFSSTKTSRSTCSKISSTIYGILSIMYISLRSLIPNKSILHGSHLKKSCFIHQVVFDLPMIKSVKNLSKAKFNDVLISTLTGSIRRYFIHKNAYVPSYIGLIIPVALTRPTDPVVVDNNFSFVLLKTSLRIEDPVHRLESTSSLTNQAKKSPEVFVNFWILKHLIRYLPHCLLEYVINNHCSSVNVVVSSINGPQDPLGAFGQEVTDLIVPIPHRGKTGVSISLVGYNYKLFVTIAIDKALVSGKNDVSKIGEFFTEEIQNLHTRLLNTCYV